MHLFVIKFSNGMPYVNYSFAMEFMAIESELFSSMLTSQPFKKTQTELV